MITIWLSLFPAVYYSWLYRYDILLFAVDKNLLNMNKHRLINTINIGLRLTFWVHKYVSCLVLHFVYILFMFYLLVVLFYLLLFTLCLFLYTVTFSLLFYSHLFTLFTFIYILFTLIYMLFTVIHILFAVIYICLLVTVCLHFVYIVFTVCFQGVTTKAQYYSCDKQKKSLSDTPSTEWKQCEGETDTISTRTNPATHTASLVVCQTAIQKVLLWTIIIYFFL